MGLKLPLNQFRCTTQHFFIGKFYTYTQRRVMFYGLAIVLINRFCERLHGTIPKIA